LWTDYKVGCSFRKHNVDYL